MNRKYRGVVIAANWKMNMAPSAIKAYAESLKSFVGTARWCDVVVCPSFVMIPAAIKAFRGSRVSIGAQDVSEFDTGAYTGEVSARQLSETGVRIVIVGHSERRARGEDDLTVNRKVHAALGSNLRPIICVGESLRQREMGVTTDFVTLQVKSALAGVPEAQIRRIVIAYEPLWAIGTGMTATAEDAGSVANVIRTVIRKKYGARVARAVPVLYGGSMNDKNAGQLLRQPDIDGGLIGTASLEPETFASIIAAAKQDNT